MLHCITSYQQDSESSVMKRYMESKAVLAPLCHAFYCCQGFRQQWQQHCGLFWVKCASIEQRITAEVLISSYKVVQSCDGAFCIIRPPWWMCIQWMKPNPSNLHSTPESEVNLRCGNKGHITKCLSFCYCLSSMLASENDPGDDRICCLFPLHHRANYVCSSQ